MGECNDPIMNMAGEVEYWLESAIEKHYPRAVHWIRVGENVAEIDLDGCIHLDASISIEGVISEEAAELYIGTQSTEEDQEDESDLR